MLGVAFPKTKKKTPGRGAAAVDLPVTACDPLDRIRIEMWEGVLAAANFVVRAPAPLPSLYTVG